MLALYFVDHWQRNHRSSSSLNIPTSSTAVKSTSTSYSRNDFQLVELGPGNGTLLLDILRVFKQFPFITRHFKQIHLVEISPVMKLKQQELLKASGLPFVLHPGQDSDSPLGTESGPQFKAEAGREGYVSVYWHKSIDTVPGDHGLATYLIGHEFLDCLPIKQYQFTPSKEWLEIHVVDKENATIKVPSDIYYTDDDDYEPELLGLVLKPTQASQLVSTLISNYISQNLPMKDIVPGQIFETCPSAFDVYKKVLPLIAGKTQNNDGPNAGTALFIDYAYESHPFKNTLRVIQHLFFTCLINKILYAGN